MKTSSKETGNAGEQVAAKYLQNRKYKIVARNYRWAHGEIDIIAEKNAALIFVEVKTATQKGFGAPETWVDERKQQQIGKTAQQYLFENEIDDRDCRFDVIAVTAAQGEWRVKHIKNAFWL